MKKIELSNSFNDNEFSPSVIDLVENDLENYFGNKNKVVALNSGTSALHLALILAGVSNGDEVLCQSMTFVASANPIVYQGASPVFVDSEPKTWNICPVYLEEAIKERMAQGKTPKAIIVVHLFGMPAQMDKIAAVAKTYDITLIEDAAEALGSTYKVQKCGTFGDYGVISFNNNKIASGLGGGALICKTQDVKDKAVFLATQARDIAPHYQHSHIGYNYRMNVLNAKLIRDQLKFLNEHIDLRRTNNSFYAALFENKAGVTVFAEPSAFYFSNHWLSAVLIDATITGFTREDLRLQLEAENIEVRPLWKPMHLQPVFKDAPYYGANVSEELFDKGLCLPSGSNLSDADRGRIKQVISAMI